MHRARSPRPAWGRPTCIEVPGAFELPLAALYLAQSGRYAGVACLGAVIRGETDHYDYVCAESARGIMDVELRTGIPCAFGVLTVENMEQALARTGGGKRDQGAHAAGGRRRPGAPQAFARVAQAAAGPPPLNSCSYLATRMTPAWGSICV